jgi:hypothetical protein
MTDDAVDQDDLDTSSEGAKSGNTRFPPYIPFPTFLTLLSELKTNGLPPQIDRSVLRRFAGGMQNQLKMALRSLGLIEGDKPTPKLKALVDAHETPAFEPMLFGLLKAVYPYVFELDLMTATPTMFADAFKATGAKEDVSRKCRTFFLHAAKRAGVPLGPRILTGSVPRSPSNGAKRKPKALKAAEVITPEVETGGKEGPDAKKLGKDHPLVTGLLMTLPNPGKKWDADARISWLRMAAFIFENIYDGKGGIKIEAEPANKTATDKSQPPS